MADFSSGVGPVSTPQLSANPVVDDSVASGIKTLGGLFESASSAVGTAVSTGNKAQANLKSLGVLNSIRENLVIKNDAVAQNAWSSQAAGSAVRRQLSRDLANHPALTDDILKVYKDTLGESVLGGAIVNGTQKEKDQHDALIKAYDDAVKAGVMPVGTDPSSPEAAHIIDTYQAFRLDNTKLDYVQKQLALQRSKVGYQADIVQLATAKQSYVTGGINQQLARLNLHEKAAEVQSRAAITDGAKHFHELLSNQLAKTWGDFKAGVIDAQTASLQIDSSVAGVTAMANAAAPDAGGDYIRNVLSPMTQLATSFKQGLDGKLTADALQNQLTATTTKATLMQIHNKPEVVGVMSMLRTFPNIPEAVARNMTDDAFTMVGYDLDTGKYNGADLSGALTGPVLNPSAPNGQKLAPPPRPVQRSMPDFVNGNKTDVKAALGWVKASIETVLSGADDSSETQQEVNRTLFTVAKSTIKYGKAADSSKDYNEVLDLLASPSFKAYVKSNKLHFEPGDAQALADTISQSYQRDVVPLIRREFLDNQVKTGVNKVSRVGELRGATTDVNVMEDTDKVIHAKFDGKSGIVFVANDPNNTYTVEAAKRLTRKIKPGFDRFIQAQANVQGSSLNSEYDAYMAAIDPGAPDRAGIKPIPLDK